MNGAHAFPGKDPQGVHVARLHRLHGHQVDVALQRDLRSRAVLHAKCVVVDQRYALVTSANFTPNAQLRNIELGVLLDAPTLAGQIVGQFEGLVRIQKLLRLPGG